MANEHKLSFIDQAISTRKAESRFRDLSSYRPGTDGVVVSRDGKELINFSSNDYLGLSRHPEVIEKSREYASRYGAGSTASRLICGTLDIHHQLEEKLAEAFETEAALLFNSGFQANSSIIGTLTDRNSLILADRLSHNSLLQGSLASRATFQRYDHNDPAHLESLLERAERQSYNRVLVVTETIFSMDGDRSPLEEIIKISDRYNALLFVDDAHAIGVWGRNGLGLAAYNPGIDILLGTCGKAVGSFGAFVTCTEKMKQYLVNYCPGFIFTTALPPAVVGAIDAALDIIPSMEEERKRFHRNLDDVKQAINDIGFNTGTSTTQIIPLIIGDERDTLELADWLESREILAIAVRPPTVPVNSSRLRIALTAQHTDEHIDRLLTALTAWKRDRS